MKPRISITQSGACGYKKNRPKKYARWKSPATAGTTSQRVCANNRELVAGRSMRIASAFMASFELHTIRERNHAWQVLIIANGDSERLIYPSMFALQPEMKVFSGSANRDLAERI